MNTISKIITSLIFLAAFPSFAQTANCVETPTGFACSGTYSSSGYSGGGASTPPPNTGTQGGGISSEAAAAKQKAEAYGKCMNDMYTTKTSCLVSVNNNLLSNQSTCSKVGVSMAGVTAGVGILISLTGVGAVAGAVITTASGATGGMIYNQCNNMAQNISNNGKEACELDFNKTKLKCDAIKP